MSSEPRIIDSPPIVAVSPPSRQWSERFESARKLYGVEKVRPEEVVVPEGVVDESFELPRGVGEDAELEVK